MKHIIAFALIITILLSSGALAAGLLPTLTEAYGISMPSLGDVLNLYPDSETKESDGSTIQIWNNVKNEDFEAFSNYLDKAGVTLLDYTVTNGIFTAKIGRSESSFTFSYDSQDQTATIIYPKGTYDKRMYDAESLYNKAKQLMEQSDYLEAIATFQNIKDYELYKDVAKILTTDEKLLAAAHEEKLKPYKTKGNIVTFGHYEQDNNTDNGQEEIEWIILDVRKNRCLLISKYGLDAKPYNTDWREKAIWETSTIRSWLNRQFLNTAFNQIEQRAIEKDLVLNDAFQSYNWSGISQNSGGDNTRDKVFLLSYAEAHKYFNVTENSNNMKSRVSPTEYAKAQGASTSFSEKDKTEEGVSSGWWWLRSPGAIIERGSCVRFGGEIDTPMSITSAGAIRPALWINLESEIFNSDILN